MLLRSVRYVLRYINKQRKAPHQRAALAEFRRVTFAPGDIAIDCGANVGEVTAELVARGAYVYAFEPNPDAFALLESRFGEDPRVECVNCAVSDCKGTAKLFLHRRYNSDPILHSCGSSLEARKTNLSQDHFVEVRTLDIAEFIATLDRRVRVFKLDIEGSEVRILNHLLDTRTIDQLDHVFCETHEIKVPGLASACRALRKRLHGMGVAHVNLNWC